MKYLALSSPSSSLCFPAQTSWGKKSQKKKWKLPESLQYVFFLWLFGCSSLGVDGWGSTTWIGGGQDRKISPQGTGWHTQRWNMGFDLCWSSEENGLGCWLVLVGSKQACRRVMMGRNGEAFSMHKWTNNHGRTVHACIHDRIQMHRPVSVRSSTHLHAGWPWHRICLHGSENMSVAPEWDSSIDIKAVQPADLLFSALQRTAHCLWVCWSH